MTRSRRGMRAAEVATEQVSEQLRAGRPAPSTRRGRQDVAGVFSMARRPPFLGFDGGQVVNPSEASGHRAVACL
jgi:hypothetical protein